jgi:hypothetical protein
MLPLRQRQPVLRLEASGVRALRPGRGAEAGSDVREAARIDDLIANSSLSTKRSVRSRLGKVHPRFGSVKVSSQRTSVRTDTRKPSNIRTLAAVSAAPNCLPHVGHSASVTQTSHNTHFVVTSLTILCAIKHMLGGAHSSNQFHEMQARYARGACARLEPICR